MVEYILEDFKKNKFSLVLSGGSAKGYAHLGILRFLDENNLKPTEVVGTSMGSIMAAFYAVGFTYKELMDKLNHTQFLTLISVKYGNGGFQNQKIYNLFDELFEGKKIKDTIIDLKICATNFETGEAKIFTKDDDIKIVDAVMASIAVPGIFSPVEIGKDTYVDGFLSSNLPIEFAKEKNLKLAANVENAISIKDIKKRATKPHFFKRKTILKNIKISFTWMMINQTRDKLKYMKNYVLIEPDLSEYKKSDFNKFEEIGNQGYKEVKKYFQK